MIDLEQRLRDELPELADALTMSTAADARSKSPRRWLPIATAVAAAVILIVGLGWVIRTRGDNDQSAATTTTPTPPRTDFGSWSAIAEAPISTRPYPVTAWTGSEAIFMAGSSLTRNFAFSDAAAYDPATDSWRTVAGTGWGHPGLVSAEYEGRIILAAKGSVSAYDPADGTTSSLGQPDRDDITLITPVVVDDADGDSLWAIGLGYSTGDTTDTPLVAARWNATTSTWEASDTRFLPEGWSASDEMDVLGWEATMAASWSGTEIVVATPTGGAAYNPATDTWRELPSAVDARPGGGTEFDPVSYATAADTSNDHLYLVTAFTDSQATIMRLDASGWTGIATIPVTETENISATAVGGWVIVFSGDDAPATVYTPTGEWQRDNASPIVGTIVPGTVWTGSELIVWGGPTGTTGPANGAIWTPPVD